MIVRSLDIANLRATEAAHFDFQPGFNLVVGVNGAGKTTMLDALAVCLSAVVKQSNGLRANAMSFGEEDIRVGAGAMRVDCVVELDGAEFTYLIHKPRESVVAQTGKQGLPREQVHVTPERSEFLGASPPVAPGSGRTGRPLAVLFSTRRAVPTERKPSRTVAAGGVAAACADAFAHRELHLGDFAAWMRVQDALKEERPQAARVLAAFDAAVARFLPGYSKLRVDGDNLSLLIDRGGITLLVRSLSDGERGTLALVLDLTRRLAQANPDMERPTEQAEAVVLIDELDLHLHPRWQRVVVDNLTATFPGCQFIATTHSPQLIGEVEHDRIQILSEGEVYRPTHSFGVDASRILEEIMEVSPRARAVHELLSKLSQAIGEDDYEQARALLADLSSRVGEDDPEVTRARTLLDFMASEG